MGLIHIGKIVKVHGLKGQVIVKTYSGNADNVDLGSEVYVIGSDFEKILTICSVQSVKSNFRIGLDEVKNRDSAEKLIGMEICVPEESLKMLSENNYYVFDLIGCRIIDEEEKEYGTVNEVINNPANDLLQIKKNKKEYLVPMIKEIVKKIDLENKQIIIKPMDGLFD
ncbi:MAG: 16S rRNA processing protein RimM [bacterium]|nr:16S rRNA processing protein RimM [bacterium]